MLSKFSRDLAASATVKQRIKSQMNCNISKIRAGTTVERFAKRKSLWPLKERSLINVQGSGEQKEGQEETVFRFLVLNNASFPASLEKQEGLIVSAHTLRQNTLKKLCQAITRDGTDWKRSGILLCWDLMRPLTSLSVKQGSRKKQDPQKLCKLFPAITYHSLIRATR